MGQSLWQRQKGLVFGTAEDADFENSYGAIKVLLVGFGANGFMIMDPTKVDEENMQATVLFYPAFSITQSRELLVGLRIDSTVGPTYGDGYWLGMRNVSSIGNMGLKIWKRVNGVLTQLAIGSNSVGFAAGDKFKLVVSVDGTSLNAEIFDDLDVSQQDISATNSDITGPGTVGFGRFAENEGRMIVKSLLLEKL